MRFRQNNTQLISELNLNESRQGMQRANQVIYHVIIKCARHAATFEKLYFYSKARNEHIFLIY